MLIHLQLKKRKQHTNSFTMQMYHRWTFVPTLRKLTCAHGINSHHNDNVSLLCELITVNSYSED